MLARFGALRPALGRFVDPSKASGSPHLTIDDPEGLRAEAREEAIKEAQKKAAVLARSLGKRLGDLKGFSEGGGYSPPGPVFMRAEAMGKGGGLPDLPFPTGEEEINIQVTLTYELR